jgi:hypothetical protein
VASGNVIVFGDGVARFSAVPDRTAGTIVFRSVEPAVKITQPPVAVIRTESGPVDVALVAVENQPGAWRLSHEAVRMGRLDGTMRIVVEGKTYSAPLTTVFSGAVAVAPRHGGRVISFADCSAHVEVVQDMATGGLTIYSFDDVQILEPPVITVTQTEGPSTVTVTRIEGQPGVWRVVHPAFKTTKIDGRIRVLVNGKPCEAPLTFSRGGQIVTVQGGPKFEVVRDERARAYTFYAVDEMIDDRPVVIERPQVVVMTPQGPRPMVLAPVPNEPRAWRLIGLEGGVSEPLDARLQFTLFGKTLETNLGLSGFGVGVR